MAQPQERTIADLIYITLNRRVIAMDRYDGSVVWEWKSPKTTTFISLLLDGDRLVASANGYIYCLDPLYGQEVWSNPLTGYGVGIASLASSSGQSHSGGAAAAAAVQAQRAAAAAAAGGATAAT